MNKKFMVITGMEIQKNMIKIVLYQDGMEKRKLQKYGIMIKLE